MAEPAVGRFRIADPLNIPLMRHFEEEIFMLKVAKNILASAGMFCFMCRMSIGDVPLTDMIAPPAAAEQTQAAPAVDVAAQEMDLQHS